MPTAIKVGFKLKGRRICIYNQYTMTEKKKILIVEDEADVVKVIKTYLESVGHDVTVANNGRLGLEALRENLPDLIITDVVMPEMGGFEFYKVLKKDEIAKKIPVLILTGRSKMEDSFKVLGVDDFLAKPFEGKNLLAKVEALFTKAEDKDKGMVKKKILITGSDKDTVGNMVFQLKHFGCETEFAMNGTDVVSKSIVFNPDVVVLDVLMEGMTAEMIVKVLRQMPNTQKSVIVLYSFYRMADLASQDIPQMAIKVDNSVEISLEAGATKYLGQFNETSFLKLLKGYLQ